MASAPGRWSQRERAARHRCAGLHGRDHHRSRDLRRRRHVASMTFGQDRLSSPGGRVRPEVLDPKRRRAEVWTG